CCRSRRRPASAARWSRCARRPASRRCCPPQCRPAPSPSAPDSKSRCPTDRSSSWVLPPSSYSPVGAVLFSRRASPAAKWGRGSGLLGRLVALVDVAPVDHLPPRLDVVGPLVLVAQVVSVLPDVAAQERLLAGHQRAVLVGRAQHLQLALVHHQP